jgi:hypothetical protein
VNAIGALAHAHQAVVAIGGGRVTDPVVLDADLCKRWLDTTCDPQVLGAGVFARVVDRLLGDPQQFGLDVEPEPLWTLFERKVDSHP